MSPNPISWKTWAVLLPGALLGAGVGALMAGYVGVVPSIGPAVYLQTVGIGVAVGSIILRVLLSERELRLSAHAGLISNGVCTFASGAAVIWGLGRLPYTADLWAMLGVVALAWIPALALTVAGLAVVQRLRAGAASKEKG